MNLGIDLGTTRSAVGVVESDTPDLVQNTNGNRLTPSIVLYEENGVQVGEQARNKMKVDQDNVVQEIKRDMGKENFEVEAGGEKHTPAEVSAAILEQLLDDARNVYDEIEDVVITVPAYFTSDQKRATKEAAKIACIDEDNIELLREPTAAALHYGDKHGIDDETVLVYDFGGGTLDISVVEIDDTTYTMLATSGNTELGGVDFTEELVDLLADQKQDSDGVDLRTDDEVYASLWENAEEAKKALSNQEKTTVNEPFMGEIDGSLVGLEESVVTRDEFERAVADLIDDALEPLDDALSNANLDKTDIDNVLMVGGSSKIPAIQNRLEDYFGFKPDMANDLDWIVAYGAAIASNIDEEVTTMYPCIVEDCDVVNEGVTVMFEHLVSEHGTDECPFDDCDTEPDGEADLKSHLAKAHPDDIAISDPGGKVIKSNLSRSLGTDVRRKEMHIIIPSSTELPAEGSAMFTTTDKNQTKVPVDVYQGENEANRHENDQLHSWFIKDIPPMDAGEPDIEVTFEVDEDEILTVTAEELKSGKKATTEIDTEGSIDSASGPQKAEADD